MRKFLLYAGVAVAFVCLAEMQTAWAQMGPYGPPGGYGPYQRPPTISPYLNLLNGGNTAINYYLLVRPEFQQRELNRQFGNQMYDLDRRTRQGTTSEAEDLFPTLPGTGHAVGFMTYSPYYNMGGVGRGGYQSPRQSNQQTHPMTPRPPGK